MMMTTNNTNNLISSVRPDSPTIEIADFLDQRLSIKKQRKQQRNCQYGVRPDSPTIKSDSTLDRRLSIQQKREQQRSYQYDVRPDSPIIEINDIHDRRLSIKKQQVQEKRCQYDNLQRAQQDIFSSSVEDSKLKAKERNIGHVDKEDEKEKQYRNAVKSLGPYDVICGKGRVAFNNIGNRRFRILITINIDRYNEAEGRHRKGLFIGSLVRTFLKDIGARFFKLKEGELIELTEVQIRQKVGHALRDVLAFQESQTEKHQKQREEQDRKSRTEMSQDPKTEINSVRPTTPTRKPKPWVEGPTTATSPSQRSQRALSSIRCRINKIRMENQAVQRLQNHMSHQLPHLNSVSFDSNVTMGCPDRFHHQNQGTRVTLEHGSVISVQKESSSESKYFQRTENLEEQSYDNWSTTNVSAASRGDDTGNKPPRQQRPWNWRTNTTFDSSIPGQHDNNKRNMGIHYDYNKCENFDNSHHRQNDDNGPLEDIDLVPIPIDDHRKEDDEVISRLEF